MITKLRAWNTKDKVMYKVGDAYGTTHDLDCAKYAIEGQPVILMLASGKQDTNGVDIFIGDIVLSTQYPMQSDGDINYVGEVYWADEDSVITVDLHCISSRVRGAACGGILSEYIDYITVIGNIYENPELLEKDNELSKEAQTG